MFYFHPYLFGEDSHFDWYFSDGLKPPTRKSLNQPVFHGSLITFWVNWSLLKCYEGLWALMLSHFVPRGSSTTFFFQVGFASFTMFQIKMSHYSKGSTIFSKRWQRRSGYHDTVIIWRWGKFTFPSRQRNFISGWTLSSDLDELKGVLVLS